MENTYVLGTIDNRVYELKWEIRKDGKFSMCGHIWNPRQTDIEQGGQCCDSVVAAFPEDKQAQEMLEVWEKYHLKILPKKVIEKVIVWKTNKRENIFENWLHENLKITCNYLGLEDKADHYHCVIQWKTGSFANLIVDWRQGIGLRKDYKGRRYSLKKEDLFGFAGAFSPTRSAPSMLDVISATISDTRYFLDYREDDFIDELYQDDWKKGRAVYRECEQQNQKLKDFFQNLYPRIMDEEDLMQDAKLNIHKNR